MDQSNGERRGNQPEYHRNPHSASPNWPSDETVSLNDDNHRRNFPGDGNHYNRRQHHHHHHHQNPNSEQNFGGSPLLSARKRPYDQSTSDSQVRFGSVKLYVVGVPRPAEEEDVRSVFAEHGNIIEVVRLKDKSTGLRKECCFVKYSTLDEADRAIGAFHGRYTFPGGEVPLIIRYADGERERLGSLGEQNHKLYVGGLRKQVSKREVEHVFSPYGVVEEVFFLLDEQKQRRGSAFVSFACKDMAVAAMNALHGTYVTTKVCHQPLIVRFADPKKPKVGESRAPSHMNEQFNGNIAANQSNHQSPNKTPNNRSNPQTVFSTYVGSDIVLPSAASSVNARSLNGEMVESIDCEWSEHICPDGFVYYYNCMTCESWWEKPEEFALYEKKMEKLDLQQQDQRNLRLPVRNNPEVSQMREELETGSSTVPLACV